MIAIVDFGSQYTQLIARRVREAHVYCEVVPYWTKPDELSKYKGIILSGSPRSVLGESSPMPDSSIYYLGKPVLGLCYGMQAMAHQLGGAVEKGKSGEYGRAEAKLDRNSVLFQGTKEIGTVWMSHGDHVIKAPKDFEVIASSGSCPVAAISNVSKNFYGLQFHPEVKHTEDGALIIENFLFKICGEEPSWKMSSFAEEQIEAIKKTVGGDHVIAGVSGGVDSVVTAVLLHKAIGKQLHVIFVDHGLLREGEREEVIFTLTNLGLDPILVGCEDIFLDALKGVTEPEQKRTIIGRLFIEEFEKACKTIPGVKWLAQGTLYPDVIESSGGVSGLADKIKSHHNVGGLPERMNLKLIEPMRMLFKDEVRHLGRELGVPKHLTDRQPFPGPGLAIRLVGEVTRQRLDILRKADEIVREEIAGDADQYFAVLLPVSSVGVQGDERSYNCVCAVRAVSTTDFMTASWTKLPYEVLDRIATRITGEVKQIGRVVFDITNKPPATIEWE
ncbi:MAG TPA: glutamine-hydrolyzing GMP synthase [Caldisericia bacterium]|nr:glutamine-hydrolyzing GMP synthase [Caldisericia bacterium]